MPERSDERLGTMPLRKLIFSMALPGVAAQLVNLLYSIVDRIYIGHIPGVGADALTGVGLCTPILLLVSAFAAFAGNGGAPLAAMELGRGDREKADRILSASFMMLIVFSAALTAGLLACRMPLLRFFGASDTTAMYADSYAGIYLVGTVFVLLAVGLNSFITCQGQAKIAMLSVVIGAVANIILDPILIFLFQMGVRGAAVATVISQALSAAWVLRFLLSGKSVLRVRLKYMLPAPAMLGRIAALGVSPFIMQITECLVSVVFTSGLQKYGGDLYVGTYTILHSVMQLIFLPTHGFTLGAQPIISYNYGAGNFKRVKRCFWCVTAVTFSYTFLFYLLVRLCPNLIAGLFTSDAALRALAAEKLPVFLFGMSIFGLQMSVQTALLGLGQAKVSIFIACLRKVFLLTPLGLLLPLIFGVDGLYYAEPVADAASALCATVLFLVASRKIFRRTKTMETLQGMGVTNETLSAEAAVLAETRAESENSAQAPTPAAEHTSAATEDAAAAAEDATAALSEKPGCNAADDAAQGAAQTPAEDLPVYVPTLTLTPDLSALDRLNETAADSVSAAETENA